MNIARKSLYAPRVITYFRAHLQAIKTSMHQLSSASLASLMTFAVIGIALALPMGLFVGLKNIETITKTMHTSGQISLYLKTGLNSKELSDITRVLKNNKEIAHIQYVSPEQGLKDFQKELGIEKELTALKSNPLPGVIIVQPIKTVCDTNQIKRLVKTLQKLPQVQQAQFDMDWLERLNAIISLGQRLTYALMLLFAFAALLITGNTIRLIMQGCQEEIKIIKLLGGTNRFIMRPFLYSGMLYGFVGSIIAWLLADSLMIWIRTPIKALADSYNVLFHPQGLELFPTLLLISCGVFLGYIGARFSVLGNIRKISLS